MDRTNVDVVRVPVAVAVVGELGAFDRQINRPDIPDQDPVLVVVQGGPNQRQRPALQPDPGAIAIRHLRTAQLHIAHDHARTRQHPDRLTATALTSRIDPRPPVDALDRQVRNRRRAHIAVITAVASRIDLNHIAGTRRSNRRTRLRIRMPRPNQPHHRTRIATQQRHQTHHNHRHPNPDHARDLPGSPEEQTLSPLSMPANQRYVN